MQLFGVTGGVGMGKSTAGELLRQQGVSVVDTDAISHQLVEPGLPALEEIVEKFGPSVLDDSGRLNRGELARLVFPDAVSRAALESILHPRIRLAWQAEVENWRAAGHTAGAVIIPLLFETNAAPLFDAVICVACSGATQWQRLRQRGWTDRQIRQRLEAQLPLDQKVAQSDYVVWTDTTLEAHAAQLVRISHRAREDHQVCR
jgi:dephospho-CoA kinase